MRASIFHEDYDGTVSDEVSSASANDTTTPTVTFHLLFGRKIRCKLSVTQELYILHNAFSGHQIHSEFCYPSFTHTGVYLILK